MYMELWHTEFNIQDGLRGEIVWLYRRGILEFWNL